MSLLYHNDGDCLSGLPETEASTLQRHFVFRAPTTIIQVARNPSTSHERSGLEVLQPPAMGTKTLQDFIEELRSQLKGRIERQDDPAPENQFISDAAPSDILTKEKLVQLFDLVLYQGRGESDFVKRDHLQSLAFAIRGQEQSRPNRSTCKVLAILLHVRCEIKTLKAFARWSLPGLNQSNTNTPLSDSRLPCTQEQADRAFGKSDGYPFWSGQSLFCPVIFKENEEVVCEHPCPLPFKEKPEEIGRGSYATVYKVKIAKGHFVNGAERNLEVRFYKEMRYLRAGAEKFYRRRFLPAKFLIVKIETTATGISPRSFLERGSLMTTS